MRSSGNKADSHVVHGACERVMDALLGLLSIQEFITSLETLLEQNDINVGFFERLESI